MDKNMSFEDAISKLDDIVRKLESMSLGLDNSLALFEEGVALVKLCNKKLEAGEQKVRLLTENYDGSVTDTAFDGADDEA